MAGKYHPRSRAPAQKKRPPPRFKFIKFIPRQLWAIFTVLCYPFQLFFILQKKVAGRIDYEWTYEDDRALVLKIFTVRKDVKLLFCGPDTFEFIVHAGKYTFSSELPSGYCRKYDHAKHPDYHEFVFYDNLFLAAWQEEFTASMKPPEAKRKARDARQKKELADLNEGVKQLGAGIERAKCKLRNARSSFKIK